MALIPYMKKVDVEKFEKKNKVDFGISEWVNIQFELDEVKNVDEDLNLSDYEEGDIAEYEANRYDVLYIDEKGDKYWLYVYMNENVDKIYAIDEKVKKNNDNEEIYYPTIETPFAKFFGI